MSYCQFVSLYHFRSVILWWRKSINEVTLGPLSIFIGACYDVIILIGATVGSYTFFVEKDSIRSDLDICCASF